MNELKQSTPNSKTTSSPIMFWGTIVMAILLALLASYFAVVLIRQLGPLVTYIGLGVFLLAPIASIISIVLVINHRQESASKLGFYATLTMGVMSVALFQGRALSASLSILVISIMAIQWLFPKQLRRQYYSVTAATILLMWVLEWINPFWRMQMQAAKLGPVAAALFALILGLMLTLQSRKFIGSSLRLQITIWTGAIIAVLSIAILTYSIYNSRQAAIQSAQNEALATSKEQASLVQGKLDTAVEIARSLASSLGVVKDPVNPVALTRDQANAILRKAEEEHPAFLGTWTLWEPNAFDGLDAQYANTPLHDQTGRFIPYWVRGGTNSAVEGIAIVDYETPKPGANDWYYGPRETKQETIVPPYFYPINNVNVLMTTISVPIVANDQFYGVAGVDTRVDFLQGVVDGINLYNGKADAILFTDQGAIVAARNQPKLALQPASSVFNDFAQIKSRLAAGETFVSLSPDGKYLRVFSPIDIGKTGHWFFTLVIPFSEITASATVAAVREGAISLGIILISILALWFFTGRLVSPILDLTKVAGAISGGDLNATARVEANNEIGILANTFNSMTAQLRGTLATLEQRVADRTRNLELAAEVGRAVSQVRSLDAMLNDACNLILKEFNLYYVQVYLADPGQTTLKLEAGTGTVGAQLVGRGHSLPLNTGSINGRAATEKHSVVISDTTQSATFRQNPLLPETRGEMAVPLIVANKVVGVVDMQSSQPGTLTEEVLPAFEALAGQLAVAVQNANLLAETEQARAQVEGQARRLVQQGWREHLDAIHKPEQLGFVFDHNQVAPLADVNELQLAEDTQAVSAPISVTGESLGSLVVELGDETQREQTNELVNIVARQVAQQIENLRLLESAERYRYEAEQASRRLTREGWQSYTEKAGEGLKYIYDLNEVRPLNSDTLEAAATVPLKVRDEVVGKFAVLGLDTNDSEAISLANSVAESLSAHIEGLRQQDETQSALAQSEKLFEASRNLTQVADLQQLVSTAVATLNIPSINRAILNVFNYDQAGNIESLDVIANWWNGIGHQVTDAGTHYSRETVRAMSMFISPTPVFFRDTLNDERVDEITMQLVKRLNLRAVAVLPLHVATGQIGALILESEEPHNFTAEETRLFTAIAPQIATIMDNRRQFERAQEQAKREAMLNTINQKIQSATSVEAVLQIAARELGHALGAPMTVAQLSMKDKAS